MNSDDSYSELFGAMRRIQRGVRLVSCNYLARLAESHACFAGINNAHIYSEAPLCVDTHKNFSANLVVALPVIQFINGEVRPMPPENLPPHALFIRWGRFYAGAVGRPAIIALLVLVIGIAVAWRGGLL